MTKKEQEFRVPRVKRNSTLDMMLRGFNIYSHFLGPWDSHEEDKERRNSARKILRELCPGGIASEDITQLSILSKKYEKRDWFASISWSYFGAAIDISNERDFRIFTGHLVKKFDYLGSYNNGKNIYVMGDCGGGVGDSMISGKIVVDGNTKGGVGCEM